MKRFLVFFAAMFCVIFTYAGDSKSPITVYIDAGHGGKDAGAVSATGHKESVLCLELAKALAEKAKERDIRVVMIRTKDEYVQLQDRSGKTKTANGASYFISIHLESSENKKESGPTIIGFNKPGIDGSVRLFRNMMYQFSKLGNVRQDFKPLVVLRESSIPAVVVSPGFISNEADLAKLQTKDYRTAVANAILDAVIMP